MLHLRKAVEPRSALEAKSAPSFQFWKGDKILEACRSPMLLNRYRRWLAAANGHLPTLSDLYGADDEAALSDALLMLREGDDFIYVHQGAELLAKIGVDFRGRRLSKVKGNLTGGLCALYRVCLQTAQPIYMQYVTDFSEQHIYWERMLLPAKSDGDSEFVLTYSLPLNDQLYVLKAIFDRAQEGMIAAAPAIGADKDLTAARILFINAQAREMLRLTSDAKIHTVKDLSSWFHSGASWTKTEVVGGEKHSRIHYTERETGKVYCVSIKPIGRFVLFAITDLAAPEGANSDVKLVLANP